VNSLIISGIAGSSMVSPYIVISNVEPKIPRVNQAILDIFCGDDDGGWGI
jgi:hypothetical protein